MITKVDIAIVGAGAAGLLLLNEIMEDKNLQSKKIALLDSGERMEKNWAFWMKEKHAFEHLINQKYQTISFRNIHKQSINSLTNPYNYQLICSNNLFDWMFKEVIPKNNQIQWMKERVKICTKEEGKNLIITESGKKIYAEIIADSRNEIPEKIGSIELKQHFYGKLIESKENLFNSDVATLMDFNFPYCENTVGFGYILPYSPNKAFVEITFFDENQLELKNYETYWNDYWKMNYNGSKFSTLKEELGVIPMSNRKFNQKIDGKYFKIGTAAGMVKNSTGYAFTRMMKDAKKLVKSNFTRRNTRTFLNRRFGLYDSLLLEIIKKEPEKVKNIMYQLFKHNSPEKIFKFLDEDSNIFEEIKIFSSLPIMLFLKYLIKKLAPL